MIPLYNLGLFSDFFRWIADTFTAVKTVFDHMITGIISLFTFLLTGFSFIYNIAALLPVIFVALFGVAGAALLIKFVVGR